VEAHEQRPDILEEHNVFGGCFDSAIVTGKHFSLLPRAAPGGRFFVILPMKTREKGFFFRNFAVAGDKAGPHRINLAPPAGFEPTAPGLGILCSIHLS
jgi:hypothetical protein